MDGDDGGWRMEDGGWRMVDGGGGWSIILYIGPWPYARVLAPYRGVMVCVCTPIVGSRPYAILYSPYRA